MLYLHLIWRQIKLVASHVGVIGRILWSFAKSHRIISAGIVVAVIAGAIGLSYLLPAPEGDKVLTGSRSVTLVRAGDSAATPSLSLVGTVRATREALVSPDASGAVSALYRNLGDYVPAGTVIAELKNDTQRAGVAQARAALQKAESATAVGSIGVSNAESSFSAAQDAARATLQSAYATLDDAVRRKADQAFSSPTSLTPKFNPLSSNSQAVNDAQSGRVAMQPILARHATVQVSGLNADGLLAEMTSLSAEVSTVQSFLQSLVQALNGGIAGGGTSDATLAAFRADASLALSSVNALASTLAGTIDNLKARRAAVAIASESLATGDGGVSADVAAAEANLSAALANLEKTLIRAPISGTINRLDLNVGAFVNASQPVVYLTSAGSLEAVVFVSGTDLADIALGAQAQVAGTVEGSVVRVATALDPVTKKAEVRIALPPSAPLVAGQSATVEIARRARGVAQDAEFSIPLSSLKITPTGPLVFTVGDDGSLVANPVTIGALRGETVVLESGITADTQIVKDARGLKEGERVVVDL